MARTKFAIIGGDYRYKLLSEILQDSNDNVNIFGNKYLSNSSDISACLKNSDIVIAPIPISKDNVNVFMDSTYSLSIEDLIEEMTRANVKNIICGVVNNDIRRKFNSSGIEIFDLFDLEEVAINNAIPTAEGAIMTAIQESDKALFNSLSLVIGYGRCGKVLSNMLLGIGSNVSVTYRKKSDEAYINAYNLTPIKIDLLDAHIQKFDFIFNTAPALVLNNETLKRIRKDSLIIDLAQAPGGLDYNYARELNLKAKYCPGLPGRVAPYTAAQILKTAIIDIAHDL